MLNLNFLVEVVVVDSRWLRYLDLYKFSDDGLCLLASCLFCIFKFMF